MDKDTLLTEIYNARTRLEDVLQKFDNRQMVEPGLPGDWSMKDLLAHFEFWERRAMLYFDMLRRGEAPQNPTTPEAVDALNREVFLQNRARDLENVRNGEMDAFRALMHQVETAAPKDLFEANRFKWLGGAPWVEWVVGNSSGHWEEHGPDVEKLLLERTTSHPAVVAARDFIDKNGRDIDQARMAYHFGQKISRDELLQALSHYQNADGGFFGLEVDIKAPVSNPFATELALRMMRWAQTPSDHPLLAKTIQHLETTQQKDGTWRFTPEVYQHDLAAWFKGWQWPNLNPSLPLSGLLKQLGVGSDRLHRRVQELFDRQARFADLTGNDFYSAKPYADYFQTEWDFPQAEFYRSGVVWWLLRQYVVSKEMDATHWLEFASSPESAISARLPLDAIQKKLDQLESEQAKDGGWPSPYNSQWRPWITVNNLLTMRAYGRI